MALRPKPPPDPLADLAGVASCPECGSIVRAYHYLHGATSVYDLGPYAMDDIEAIVGPAWALRQGYGLGRAAPHSEACPPIRPGELVALVVAQDDAPGRPARPGASRRRRPMKPADADHPTTKARTA